MATFARNIWERPFYPPRLHVNPRAVLPNPPFYCRAPFQLPRKELPIAAVSLRPGPVLRITRVFPARRPLSRARPSPVVDTVRNPQSNPSAIRRAMNPVAAFRSSIRPTAPIHHRILSARLALKTKHVGGPPASVANYAILPLIAVTVAPCPGKAPSTPRTGSGAGRGIGEKWGSTHRFFFEFVPRAPHLPAIPPPH